MYDETILFPHSGMLFLGARLVRESRILMHDGWRATAASRRRVLRRPVIAGGASDETRDDELRASIRARLVSLSLPCVDGRSWAGRGTGGNRCVCCGAVIACADGEFEPETHAGLYAHARCHQLWVTESIAALRLASG